MPLFFSQNILYKRTRELVVGNPVLEGQAVTANMEFKAPSTLTKTELFCSGYGYRPHYNAENRAIGKRFPEWRDLKTMLLKSVI